MVWRAGQEESSLSTGPLRMEAGRWVLLGQELLAFNSVAMIRVRVTHDSLPDEPLGRALLSVREGPHSKTAYVSCRLAEGASVIGL